MFLSTRGTGRRRHVAAFLSTALVAAGVSALTIAGAGPAAAAATGGVGANLPYVEVQAEDAATNGTRIGPSADYGTLADEASFRKAVTLSGSGKYVEFTSPTATNSMVFRYSIPDTSGGSVYTAPLSLYINGTKSTNFTLTNAYSWYYGSYPFTNSPGSNPHHFYDEVNRLFPTTYPAGTTFRLQVDADSTASSYTIDFADFETVGGAAAQPSGSVSVTSKGADPTGAADATAAFTSAISAAGAGGTVWIPEGVFKIPGHLVLNNITIKGAGMWRSRVVGAAPGFYGGYVPNASTGVHLADFAIFGDVRERNDADQVNGIGGAMNNSTVDRIWIEHLKVGAWMDGPFTNLVLSTMRIRNVTADGVNFHNGVTNSKVTNSDLRNAGDDALATWSEQNADSGDSFDHNTIQYPILANGIAIYGGHDNFVTDNRVIDSGLTQGGGIHVAQRFASTTLGRTDVLRNTIVRSGGLDPNWQFGVGALWFDARDGAMTGLTNVDNILIQQSPYEAIQFVSGSNITNVKINNATIQNTGTFVVQEQVGGSATITNSTATGTQAPAPIYSCSNQFNLVDGGGNSGIFGATQCGFVNPTFPPYLPDNTSGIAVSPTTVGFGSVATGATSAAQTVSITNTGTAAAPVGPISVTGDFTQSATCGSSLAAGASCTASVRFTPTAVGARTGTLSITAGGSTQTVSLTGTGTGTNTNLAAGRTATASSQVNSTQAATTATDGDANTYWESTNGAFPQWLQVDLGAAAGIGKVVLKLPPATAWATRTQTLSVQTSVDGAGFSTPVPSATYTFNPASANTVTIPVPTTTARYVRLNITANSGWPAGQISELEVYPGTGTTTPAATLSSSPSSLSFASQALNTTSAAKAVTVTNTGSAAAAVSTVAASGDFSQTNTCGSSIAAGASCTVSVSFRPAASGARTGSLTVTSNATNSPTTIALTGTGDGGSVSTNLAAGKATSESSHADVYVSARVTDNDQASYWESANNAFPQWVQVDLGSAQSASRVVLQLPPTWGARNQTLSLLGSTNGTDWTTLKASASHAFAPAGNNAVTISFTASSQRYFRADITANTEWPAGQLSGFQVWNI